MASFDHARDLNDIALKPRLLRTLTKDHLPSEKRAFRNPSELSSIVSRLRTHQLLSQQTPPSADPKHVSSWNSAVDSWVDRVLSLVRADMPDKCWAGVCLLGLTCTECSSERFLASYQDWFNVLFSHIQPSGVSKIVKVASCAAVSDLLTRLGGYSNMKKDGNSFAMKLVQPVLKMLNEDANEAMLEIAAHLLITVLTHFPSSVHRHYDNAEAAIVSKLMSGNSNADLMKKLSCCLASLPKSKGDEESWSLMMQKILLCLSALLNSALEGLEEESKRGEAVTLLVPPGKDPPPPLGGQLIGGEALNNGEISQQLVISTISSLLHCCCTMLTGFYPVQVAVPVSPLLALVGRVLRVNGSLPEALQLFTTAMQQEFVCFQLPVLQLNVLDVFAALVKGLHSQLLPHAADLMWLLIKYFERCKLPELRTKVYTIIRALLISMGAGLALYIAQEVIDNGTIDLKFSDSGSDKVPLSNLSLEASLRQRHKRRKHGAKFGPFDEQHASCSVEVKAPKEFQAPVSLKIAAIEALEALLVVGGALRSDSWRSNIDRLLIEVVTNALNGDWNRPLLSGESSAAWEEFQLAALHALLASLLCSAGVRPPYLAQGLELFQKGKRNTGTKVAEFCAQALLALEVFIHPRALPLMDVPFSSGNSCFVGRTDLGAPSPYPNGNLRKVVFPDVYDIQDDFDMENGPESKVPVAEVNKDEKFDGKKLDFARGRNLEEPNIVTGSSDKVLPQERGEGSESTKLGGQKEVNDDIVMLDVLPHEDLKRTSPRTVFLDGDSFVTPSSDPLSAGKGLVNDKLDLVNRSSTSDIHAPIAKSIAATGFESEVAARSDNNSSKVGVIDKDDESSDSFPDIVDADPDTDSD